MLKAILFDLDGTLINTNPLITRSFKETFQELLPGKDITEAELLSCVGPTLEQSGQKHYAHDVKHFVDTYRRYCFKYHDEMVTIYPGIEEMLKELRKMDLKLVIVTSKKRDMATKGMEFTNIATYFDWMMSADEVKNPKPHKEPICNVLDYYGLKPEECLMVGDNSHDIECARAAGVKSVAVGWAFKGADYLRKFYPNYMIEEAMELVEIVKEGVNGGKGL